jgi:hypothetical protein
VRAQEVARFELEEYEVVERATTNNEGFWQIRDSFLAFLGSHSFLRVAAAGASRVTLCCAAFHV